MYKIKKASVGKLYCYSKGCFPLNDNLKQSVLKQLFKDNCEHIYYGEAKRTSEETKTSESTAKEDISNNNTRRKTDRGKANKKLTNN